MDSERYQRIYDELRAYVGGLTILDTHEHLPAYEVHRDSRDDVLSEYLIHYFSSDLVSAGLPVKTLEEVRSPGLSVAEKWEKLSPYWQYARHTGYGRALALAAADIYGVDRIDADSIEALNDRFVAARTAGDHYRLVLREKCKIECSILDGWCEDADSEFFRIATQVAPFVIWENAESIGQAEQLLRCKIEKFGDYVDAVAAYLENMLDSRAICLKCALAYQRSLRFDKPDRGAAKAEFKAMVRGGGASVFRNSTQFQNFMMHQILALANRLGAVVQFHTGLQEGNGNDLTQSDPLLLNNLFSQYPDVRFDLFHIGYPFVGQTAALAKNFPNVYIDMCWAHIISPHAAVAALEEFLDTVPYNKISAFGGDYCFVDGVYGHQRMARDNVSAALARKVCAGVFEPAEAEQIARRLFHDNPQTLFPFAKFA